MNVKGLKYYLLFFALVAVFPLMQQLFHFFKVPGLSGVYVMSQKPVYTFDGLVDGSFQSNADVYIKENTDFRADFVRLHNQIDYTLFGNINTILTLGKNNYIFDPNYIYALEGKDFLSDSIKSHEKKSFASAKQILDSLNIPLFFIIAPNKANFYKEYLPAEFKKSRNNNQTFFKKLVLENNVTVLDMDAHFYDIKITSEHTLMPKYGAHWSTYGASLVADTLLRQVEKKLKKKVASYKITSIDKISEAKFNDDDYLASLNLIAKWKSPELSYPQLSFIDGYKPNLLIISDSFFWNFYDLGVVENCFSSLTEFWYYNKSVYNTKRSKVANRTGSVSIANLKNRDAIVFIATAPSMLDFGYGFFEQLNQLKNE